MEEKELTIEEEVAQLLQKYRLSITTAESCTGGLIAGTLVNVSGISSQFNEGYITYSNEAKERLLGVSHATLETYGAVSEQTAEEMAAGARCAAHADMSIVSTGIAGPDGGTKEKPVGLVYLGCASSNGVTVERHIFSGSRQEVRMSAVHTALTLVKKVIESNEKCDQ